MAPPFRWFVVLAGMRTGSNLLESCLNAAEGVTCHGEAFNPHFIGYPNQPSLLGYDLTRREIDPSGLVEAIAGQPGLNGFRLFPGHDPRILARALEDRSCAKIVLSRPPLDSYLSLCMARATGQWKLGNAKNRKTGDIRFSEPGFLAFLEERDAFHEAVRGVMQRTGQTAFHIGFQDLSQIEVINGLLGFLGATPLGQLPAELVRQNPDGLAEAVVNRDEMASALARIDWPGRLTRDPVAETRRGPQVPGYLAAAGAPILFMPVPGVAQGAVRAWLASLGKGPSAGLVADFTQASLRAWMRNNPSHRAFCLVRHPVPRAWDALAACLKSDGAADLCAVLRRLYGIRISPGDQPQALSADQRHALFLSFLRFLKENLGGQTSLRTPPAWSSQSVHLAGFSGFRPPDLVARADRLADDLAVLAGMAGLAATDTPPQPFASDGDWPEALADIHDAAIDDAARAAYPRDFLNWGFGKVPPRSA
jgi:hypothetical protein